MQAEVHMDPGRGSEQVDHYFLEEGTSKLRHILMQKADGNLRKVVLLIKSILSTLTVLKRVFLSFFLNLQNN